MHSRELHVTIRLDHELTGVRAEAVLRDADRAPVIGVGESHSNAPIRSRSARTWPWSAQCATSPARSWPAGTRPTRAPRTRTGPPGPAASGAAGRPTHPGTAERPATAQRTGPHAQPGLAPGDESRTQMTIHRRSRARPRGCSAIAPPALVVGWRCCGSRSDPVPVGRITG